MRRLILGSVLVLLGAGMAQAQPMTQAQRAEIVQIVREALVKDPSILRDALASLQKDETLREDVAARAAISTQREALNGTGDPVAGNPAGDVTVVEFYDTRCPYCRGMLPTLAALLRADPKVRLVYKDLPILGPTSMLEARALLAAQRQDGYLKLQDAVMHSSAPSTAASLRAEAERLGLNGARLERDMADPAIQARLDANIRLANALHVEGTPALVVGTQMIPGAVELAELQQAVTAARTQ
ncbi:MAG: DsbA family protein [Acetobacteraceae bacterium]